MSCSKRAELNAPLTHNERAEIFRRATGSFASWYAEDIDTGMTDDEIEDALKRALGAFGGSGSRGELNVCYTGAGLKIWGGWKWQNHCIDPPTFSGHETVTYARTFYAISDPNDDQLSLF